MASGKCNCKLQVLLAIFEEYFVGCILDAVSQTMKLIFQLGTNNWQTDDEPAPGSGILHEIQHNVMNQMDGVKCYSMFPSPKHQKPACRDDYRVFRLTHPIPICESAAPGSSYRWHSMSDLQFNAYRQCLVTEVYEYMAEVEKNEGVPFTLAIAHHSFLNPLVMRQVSLVCDFHKHSYMVRGASEVKKNLKK